MIKLEKPRIFVWNKKHFRLQNGDSEKKLPKGLIESLKKSGYIEENKDGNKIRK